jgi:prepilin-type N-terminal cleavage/methylation domain-containing protein
MIKQKVSRLSPSKRGFTLLEVLLAAAIFTLGAYMLAVTFNNAQSALLNWENRTNFQKIRDWAIDQIAWEDLDQDALEAGGSFTSAEDYDVEWIAFAEPTQVLDLFIVEVDIAISERGIILYESTFTELRRGNWYENREREELLEDKTRLFEQIRSERSRL